MYLSRAWKLEEYLNPSAGDSSIPGKVLDLKIADKSTDTIANSMLVPKENTTLTKEFL